MSISLILYKIRPFLSKKQKKNKILGLLNLILLHDLNYVADLAKTYMGDGSVVLITNLTLLINFSKHCFTSEIFFKIIFSDKLYMENYLFI